MRLLFWFSDFSRLISVFILAFKPDLRELSVIVAEAEKFLGGIGAFVEVVERSISIH